MSAHVSVLSWQNWWQCSDNQLESKRICQAFASYKSVVFKKGSIKKVDTFWVETPILPNIFKNKFQLWKHKNFLKEEWIFLPHGENECARWHILLLAYISLSKFLNFTTEFCPNLHINLSEHNIINGPTSAVPDFGHFQFLHVYEEIRNLH